MPGKLGLARGFWKDRRKGLFILFENRPWKIQTFCEYMRMPYANFEIINF